MIRTDNDVSAFNFSPDDAKIPLKNFKHANAADVAKEWEALSSKALHDAILLFYIEAEPEWYDYTRSVGAETSTAALQTTTDTVLRAALVSLSKSK